MFKQRKHLFQKADTTPKPATLTAVIPMDFGQDGTDTLLYHELLGKPLIVHTLLAYEQMEVLDEIIIILPEEQLKQMADLCRRYKLSKVSKLLCATNTESTSLLRAVYECDNYTQYIAMCDPKSPFVTEHLMQGLLKVAAGNGVAAPAVPVRDTIKTVENGKIVETPDRANLHTMQGPRVIEISLCKAALTHATETQIDFMLALENMGVVFSFVKGYEENICITSERELIVAEMVLGQWESGVR